MRTLNWDTTCLSEETLHMFTTSSINLSDALKWGQVLLIRRLDPAPYISEGGGEGIALLPETKQPRLFQSVAVLSWFFVFF